MLLVDRRASRASPSRLPQIADRASVSSSSFETAPCAREATQRKCVHYTRARACSSSPAKTARQHWFSTIGALARRRSLAGARLLFNEKRERGPRLLQPKRLLYPALMHERRDPSAGLDEARHDAVATARPRRCETELDGVSRERCCSPGAPGWAHRASRIAPRARRAPADPPPRLGGIGEPGDAD
jgi:hypothetical protein